MNLEKRFEKEVLAKPGERTDTFNWSKFISRLVIGLVCALTVTTFNSLPASAANSGTVKCMSESTVVGVWVTVSGGTSGWASRSSWVSPAHVRWSYNTQNKPYKLTVGCGGTPAKWATSSSTATFRTNWTDVFCWDRNGRYGGGTIYVLGSCTG